MRHLRRALPITIGLAASAASFLLACGDDDTAAAPHADASTTPEASATVDSGPPTDSGGGGTDAGTDTGSDTGADAGPTMTTAVLSGGEIQISDSAVLANFYEDDSVLHWSNAPGCVAYVRGQTKGASAAGKLTIAGNIIGTDGGSDIPIEIDPDPQGGNIYFWPPPIFPSVDTSTLTVERAVSPSFPALPVQTMRPPPAATVTLTAPAAPDAGASIAMPSATPFTITWTAPTGGFVAEQQIVVALVVTPTTGKNVNLHCAFPLSAGTATIPANVLTEVKTRAGGPTDALLHVLAGSAKEVTTATSSYYIEVVRFADSTSLPNDQPAKLQ